MPTSSPGDRFTIGGLEAHEDPMVPPGTYLFVRDGREVGRIVNAPADPLVGLTAGEALERLQEYPHPDRDDGHLLAAIAERYGRPGLLRRLWTRLRQAYCAHPAATAHRIAGFGPDPVFERRCGRCEKRWTEVG